MSNDVLTYALLLAHGDRETTDRLRAFIDDPNGIEEHVEEDYRPGKKRRLFDRWLYESGSRTPPRPGLVWKDSTKRWVKPGNDAGGDNKPKADKPQAEPKPKKPTAAQQKKVARETAVTAARELIADPSKLTPDHLPGLAANLGHLSQSELKETAKRLSAKVGGTKSALAERIVAALKLQKELTTDPRTKAIASVLEQHRNGDIDLAEAVEAIKAQQGGTAPAPAAKAEPTPIDRTNDALDDFFNEPDEAPKPSEPEGDLRDNALLDGLFGEPEPEPKPEPKAEPKAAEKPKAEPKPKKEPKPKAEPKPAPAPAPKKAALPPEKRGIYGGHILPLRDPETTAIGNQILDSGADEAITNAYNHLTDFGRFESGIVDFPSLFRQVQKEKPELTDYQLKLAILAMDGTGSGVMHSMNEVNMFSKDDKSYLIEDADSHYIPYYFSVSSSASEGGKGSPKIDLAKLRALRGK